jgi:hypothetical protein
MPAAAPVLRKVIFLRRVFSRTADSLGLSLLGNREEQAKKREK